MTTHRAHSRRLGRLLFPAPTLLLLASVACAPGSDANLDPVAGAGGSGGTPSGDTEGDDPGPGATPDGGTELDPGELACTQDPDSRVPCEFEGLPDPTSWWIDPQTGLRARRVTAEEREANGWTAGTFLVELGPLVDAVEEGSEAPPVLLVPLADGRATTVALEALSQEVGAPMVRITAEGAISETPTLAHYISASDELPEAWVTVSGTVGSLRGLVAHGMAGGYEIDVHTWGPGWTLSEIQGGPAPAQMGTVTLKVLTPSQDGAQDSCAQGDCGDICLAWAAPKCEKGLPGETPPCTYEGEHPCVNTQPKVDLGECDDGADNDGDGEVDFDGFTDPQAPDRSCQHQPGCFQNGTGFAAMHDHRFESGEDILLTGNLEWCSKHEDWYTEGHEWAKYAAAIMAKKTGHVPYDHLAENPDRLLRLAAVQCWVLDPQEIDPCENDGVCGPYGPASEHPYPFAGLARQKFSDYLDMAWPAAAHASDNGMTQPPTLSAVLAQNIVEVSSSKGKGRFPDSATPGAIVVVAADTTPYAVMVHEIGHTLGLEHREDDPIMKPSAAVGGEDPVFTPYVALDIYFGLRDLQIPRAYTFGK